RSLQFSYRNSRLCPIGDDVKKTGPATKAAKPAVKKTARKAAKRVATLPAGKATKQLPKNSANRKAGPTLHEHFHKDGSLWARGELRDGVLQGPWEWFRKDGSRMRAGSFTDGVQTGNWTTYASDGRVVKVTKMKG
ncbi:MAG: hypothetical protein ABJB74_13960, partial [Gemmatimonas sp.]